MQSCQLMLSVVLLHGLHRQAMQECSTQQEVHTKRGQECHNKDSIVELAGHVAEAVTMQHSGYAIATAPQLFEAHITNWCAQLCATSGTLQITI
jgi:hypothetical protein